MEITDVDGESEVAKEQERGKELSVRQEKSVPQNFVIMAGRWVCYLNGQWDFKLDKSRMGRSINCGEVDDYDKMKEIVLKEFNLRRDIDVEMSYWVADDFGRGFAEATKPVVISDNQGVALFLSLHKGNKCVNMFATFRVCVDGDLRFLEEGEDFSIPTSVVVVGEGSGMRNSPPLEIDDDELIAHVIATEERCCLDKRLVERVEQSCEEDFVSSDGEESEESEEEDYDFDFWTDFINEEYGEKAEVDVSDDDFVETPVRSKSNQKDSYDDGGKKVVDNRSVESLLLHTCTREVSCDEIYGFDDVEPIFDNLGADAFDIHDIDFTKEDDNVYVGRIFKNKEDFKIAMSIYAIKRLFRFRISRHAKFYTVMQCIDRKCDWRVYARQFADCDLYEVRKANLSHTCSSDTRGQFSKHATSKVIAALLRSKYGNVTSGPRARDLPEMVLADHHIDASYWKCWKAKELAIAEAHGTEEESYKILPLYLEVLKHANPGTICELKTEVDKKGDKRFKYVFMSLGASINGLKHLRRVVVVDGTHLHGKYKGCLLTASGQDANFQIFPLAFAVVDGENDASWSWFLEKVNEIVPDGKDLVFVSDRCTSISKGIRKVFPMAHHGACLVHLGRNIAAKFSTKFLSDMVKRAGEVYRVSEFNVLYGEIKKKKETCRKYLDDIGVAHWSRAHFQGMQYNLMSSNIAESLNKALLPARDSPIVSLLEFIRRMLCRWFNNRRKKVASLHGELSTEVDKLVTKHLEQSVGMSVSPCSTWDFEVRGKHGGNYHVNLEKRSCSCLVFDKLKIPCSHAIAAIRKVGMKESAFVDELYKKGRLAATYKAVILPVPEPDDIEIPITVKEHTPLPPKTRRPPGRPCKKRVSSEGEFNRTTKKARVQKCSRCNGTGHNRVTCKNPLD